MRAEVLTIGDELCRGEIVDRNAAFLAGALWDLDITVDWMTSCRDVDADIESAVRAGLARADVILVSGGLGPTVDDRTVDVASAMASVAPEIEPRAREFMLTRLKQIGRDPSDDYDRQVRVPQGARVFANAVGLAPGFEIQLEGKPVIFLPGPPRELQPMVRGEVLPSLLAHRDRQGRTRQFIARRIYRTFGRGESQVITLLGDAVAGPGVSLHYQASFPEVLVKVVVRSADQETADTTLEALDVEVRKRLAPHCYGIDDDSLSKALGRELRRRGETMATAESCTGGLVAARLTDPPGASEYFAGTIVAYENRIKTEFLGVSEEILEAHGAVSEETVIAMAQGVVSRMGVDWGVSVSGTAGPAGGTKDKPVGTVWLAVHGHGKTKTRKLSWPGTREQIRELSAYGAMGLVLRMVRDGG